LERFWSGQKLVEWWQAEASGEDDGFSTARLWLTFAGTSMAVALMAAERVGSYWPDPLFSAMWVGFLLRAQAGVQMEPSVKVASFTVSARTQQVESTVCIL
jgi:hypothetical protein